MNATTGWERFRKTWDGFWFPTWGPENLGVCRLLISGLFLWSHAAWDFSLWTQVSDSFWMPVSLFHWLGLDIPPASFVRAIQSVFRLALTLGCLGLFTRASFAITFLTSLYLFGLRQSFGFVEPAEGHFLLMFGIFALSRCGDAFSIDALVRRAHGSNGHIGEEAARGGYSWPVRLMQAVFVSVFFAAGVTKLHLGGLEWFLSDNLALTVQVIDLGPFAHWLAGQIFLGQMLAVSALALELLSPLALFSTRARVAILPSLFLMQMGFGMTMGATFRTFFLTYAFWVPWDRLLEFGRGERSRRRSAARLALLALVATFVGWTLVISPFERSLFPFLRSSPVSSSR